VAGLDRLRRLGALAVDLDLAARDGLRGQRASLEEARRPQPLVHADGVGVVGHDCLGYISPLMNTSAQAFGYVHRYLPPSGDDPRTLLLLHGTGGDENDLIPLGQMLAPDAGLLSPRGTVNENGAPRFFKRLAEGVFDIDDLHARTKDLVAFVEGAAGQYHFDPKQGVAGGFSEGGHNARRGLLSSPAPPHSPGPVPPLVSVLAAAPALLPGPPG